MVAAICGDGLMVLPTRMRKVYILGAGFSVDCGIPLQSSLPSAVSSLASLDIVDLAPYGELGVRVASTAHELAKELSALFDAKFPATMEDAFTILDSVSSGTLRVPGHSLTSVTELRNLLTDAICFILLHSHAQASSFAQARYAWIADYLANEHRDGALSGIVNMNWDNILAESFSVHCKKQGIPLQDLLCLHPSHHLTADTASIPEPKLVVLNIHGNVSWTMCQVCGVIIDGTGLSSVDLARRQFLRDCPVCDEPVGGIAARTGLPMLVSPTYLKYNSPPIMQSYWNAAVRLIRRADTVVFVGYSLPSEDYHFRALLARSGPWGEKQIEVVLAPQDEPPSNRPAPRYMPQFRYERVFKNVRFNYSGTLKYFKVDRRRVY